MEMLLQWWFTPDVRRVQSAMSRQEDWFCLKGQTQIHISKQGDK